MDYYSEDGNNLIREWYEKQGSEVQADFDSILNILAATQDWRGRKDCAPLRKRHVGLWEIRFTVNKVRYRPVGFFGPKAHEFTIILGSRKEKRGHYSPANAFDVALELRRKLLQEGKGYIREHD